MFKSRLHDLFSPNYANELLGSYVTIYLQCKTICHYVISHCWLLSNHVWMFLGWTPTKIVKIGVLPLFFMELWYVTCIFTMYYYMSLCNIPFLTSFKPKNRYASNFLWMFFWWTPTKFVKIWVLPLLLWDFG